VGADRKFLRAVEMTLISNDRCQKEYVDKKITDRMICARLPEEKKSPCLGDEGGALVLKKSGKQIGIVSWSNGCAYADYPTVFTDVSDGEIHAFIDSELQQVAVESSSKGSEA